MVEATSDLPQQRQSQPPFTCHCGKTFNTHQFSQHIHTCPGSREHYGALFEVLNALSQKIPAAGIDFARNTLFILQEFTDNVREKEPALKAAKYTCLSRQPREQTPSSNIEKIIRSPIGSMPKVKRLPEEE